MKTEPKYLVLVDDQSINFVAFSENLIHADVASRFPDKKVVSAGHICFGVDDNGRPRALCYGESESLQIKSNGQRDSQIANIFFNLT